MTITRQDKLWRITVRRDSGDQWPALAVSSRITVYPDELLVELDDMPGTGPMMRDILRSVTVSGRWRNQNGPLHAAPRKAWLSGTQALNQLGGAFLYSIVMAAYEDLHARHEARRKAAVSP